MTCLSWVALHGMAHSFIDFLKEINPEYLLEGLMLKQKFNIWPPDANSQLTEKDPNAWKDSRQKKKRATEDEMVGWHHRFNGHKLRQTPRNSEGQGGLAHCSPWGHRELDTTW